MPRRKPSRTALRRRGRAERPAERGDAARVSEGRGYAPRVSEGRGFAPRVLGELERAGSPLTPDELAKRLRVHKSERGARGALGEALAALERTGEVVRNRAGSLLVAKRIAVVAGRVEGHADGHGFLVPDEGGAPLFIPPAEMRQAI